MRSVAGLHRRACALGTLLGLDVAVHLALGAVGTKNRPHHQPEDQADENGRRNREGGVRPEVFKHSYRLRAIGC